MCLLIPPASKYLVNFFLSHAFYDKKVYNFCIGVDVLYLLFMLFYFCFLLIGETSRWWWGAQLAWYQTSFYFLKAGRVVGMFYYLFKNYMACGSLFGVCLRIHVKGQSLPLLDYAHSLSQPVFFFFWVPAMCLGLTLVLG